MNFNQCNLGNERRTKSREVLKTKNSMLTSIVFNNNNKKLFLKRSEVFKTQKKTQQISV